jgi:hypothetical protein
MGSLNNGPFSSFNGKIGNLVSYTLKGKNVVRTIGSLTKPPTPAQLANQMRMAVVNAFLKPITSFINSGFEFEVAGTTKNPYNEAVSYNKKHALQGDYPEISIDYSKALVSMGELSPALNAAIAIVPEGLEFTWDLYPAAPSRSKTDRTMLLLFFPDQAEAIYILSGAQRKERRDVVELSAEYLNRRIEAYIAFVAADRKSVSDSVWVGVNY